MIDELVIELFGWQQVLVILHRFVKSGFNGKNHSIRRFNDKDSRERREAVVPETIAIGREHPRASKCRSLRPLMHQIPGFRGTTHKVAPLITIRALHHPTRTPSSSPPVLKNIISSIYTEVIVM